MFYNLKDMWEEGQYFTAIAFVVMWSLIAVSLVLVVASVVQCLF